MAPPELGKVIRSFRRRSSNSEYLVTVSTRDSAGNRKMGEDLLRITMDPPLVAVSQVPGTAHQSRSQATRFEIHEEDKEEGQSNQD